MRRALAALGPPAGLVLLTLIAGFLPGMLGAAAAYPALGVFPGMAVASAIGWRRSRARRWLLGLCFSPLVSAGLGWVLLHTGVPLPAGSRAIAIGGALLWAALELARARAPEAEPEPGEPMPLSITLWSLALAAAVAIPPLFNAFVRVHGDGWVHAGIAYEIATRGVPPEDPRFAGLPLNYVWFYNLFLAQLTSLRDQDVFAFMAVLNVVFAALITRLGYRLGFAIWGDRRAGVGAALLLTLGFNAGAYLLWPLKLVKAFTGNVRGMAEVSRQLASAHMLDDRVFFQLSAPFAHEVSFLDKFLLGTALTYAWVLLVLYLEALALWVSGPRRGPLLWAGLAAMGLQLFHFVPGLSVIPVTIGALVLIALLRRRWPWLPSPGRLAVFVAATLAGTLVVLPYTLSITRGWSAGSTGLHESHFHLGLRMLWTLVTSCAVGAAFAWGPLRRLIPERRVAGVMIAAYLLGMTLFAIVVHLTEDNESKFAFQAFVALAVLGGPAFLPTIGGWIRRWGAVRTAFLLIVLFLNHALLLVGYLADPRARTAPELSRDPAEARLYAWVRDSTAARAVFVDAGHRDFIMVRGRRRLYYGSAFGPERAGFPLPQVIERRAVMDDLYGPGAHLDEDARALANLGDPVFVVFRPEDRPPAAAPGAPRWQNLERRADRFTLAHAGEGYRVYALRR